MATSSLPPTRPVASEFSHITLLRPRHSAAADSIPYDVTFFRNSLEIDREKWRDRKDFFCTTLSFCLSLANLWRFPRQAYMFGQGTFVLLYIIFAMLFGSSLLFFEVALGQYSSKGFTRVFAACPLFEGVCYSMVGYCACASVIFNCINMVTFSYIFGSFVSPLPFSDCLEIPGCIENASSVKDNPEFLYFSYVLPWNGIYDNRTIDTTFYVSKNIGIELFLWLLVAVGVIAGMRTFRWPFVANCAVVFLVLILVFGSMLSVDGSSDGVLYFLTPKIEDFINIETWSRAFEQMLVTLGLGVGPMITFGSFLSNPSPVHLYCLAIAGLALIAPVLFGAICFGALGILAKDEKVPIEDVFDSASNELFNPHVLLSYVFQHLSEGYSNFLCCLTFSMLLITGWLAMLFYTETVVLGLFEFGCLNSKAVFNVVVCILLCVFSVLLQTFGGHYFIMILTDEFIGRALFVIIILEIFTVIFIYGLYDFCDDLEFLLGCDPNSFYQFVWMFSAPIFMLNITFVMIQYIRREYDWISLLFIFVVTVLPVTIVAFYVIFYYARKGKIGDVVYPRTVAFAENTGRGTVDGVSYISSLSRP